MMRPVLMRVVGVVCDPPVVGRASWNEQMSALVSDVHWTFVEVFGGTLSLPNVNDTGLLRCPFDAVVVSGSVFNVTEIQSFAWMQETGVWLLTLMRRWPDVRVIGICFGHQLLCHMLGGRVGPNPRGWQLGTYQITVDKYLGALDAKTSCFVQELFQGASRLMVQETHAQVVLEPPKGAIVLAATERDPYHVVLYSPHVLGVQYHPEYSTAFMRQLRQEDEPIESDFWTDIEAASTEAVDIVQRFLVGIEIAFSPKV
jgi:GMP synthase-like glutamine amidotransferase